MAAVAWIVALAPITACHSAGTAEPPMDAAVPADTMVLAGFDCARLRAAPVYARLPPIVTAWADAMKPADHLLLAWNGKDLLMLGHGPFGKQAPASATRIADDLAAAGSPDAVKQAMAAYQQAKRGAGNASPLVERAPSLAHGHEIWLAAQGSAILPVNGNLQNLQRLLNTTQTVTLAVHVTDAIDAQLTAYCPTADAADHLAGELRAMLTLAAAAEARNAPLAALLRSVPVDRDGFTVKLSLHAGGEAVERLRQLF